MQNGRKQQAGMTAIGWMIVLALIAFFTLIGLRLAPLYLEYFNVTSALTSLQREPQLAQKPAPEITQLLMRRLDINDVRNVKREHVRVRQERGVVQVAVEYEVRVPLLGNVDAVASFNRRIEVAAR
jgi:hypothetical protein